MTEITLLAGQREKGESNKAVQACNEFLRLGPGRSIVGLFRSFNEVQANSVPIATLGTLQAWSSRYHWQERAAEYDGRAEEEKNARVREIMQSGLALAHERVQELKDLALFLKKQIYEQDLPNHFPNVWVRDVKQIGGGQFAREVTIERFNGGIIEQFRGTLEDLAKETGGRTNKTEISGPDGGPVQTACSVLFDQLSEDELAQVILNLLIASGNADAVAKQQK